MHWTPDVLVCSRISCIAFVTLESGTLVICFSERHVLRVKPMVTQAEPRPWCSRLQALLQSRSSPSFVSRLSTQTFQTTAYRL